MARIREKALQLLDDLVELRKASNPVRAMFLSSIPNQILRGRQRADVP
jgi:hypothetical protein